MSQILRWLSSACSDIKSDRQNATTHNNDIHEEIICNL